MRLILPLIALLSIAACAVKPEITTAAQEQPDTCTTMAEMTEMAHGAYPGSLVVRVKGDTAVGFASGIGAATGAHIPQGAEFLIVTAPGVDSAYVVMFVNGCADKQGEFPLEAVQKWVRGEEA